MSRRAVPTITPTICPARTGRSRILIAAVLLVLACGAAVVARVLLGHNHADQIAGVVLDSAGRPVTGVRVFNHGDAPETIETRTDATGHFCLRGFEPGTVYVFGQKSGYRFTGLRTRCGVADVRLTLLGRDESPPAWKPIESPPSPDEQQKLARRLLERLWATKPYGDRCYWLIRAMSRIDPATALRWSAGLDPTYADLSRAAMAEELAGAVPVPSAEDADVDFGEALDLMRQSGPEGMNLLARLGRQYAASDPARAMRCAEELTVLARAVDQPWRAGYLAQAGALAVRLGKPDAGQALLEEAAEMVARLPSAPTNDAARGMVAAAMAETNLTRAEALLDPIPANNGLDRFRGNVAVAGCLAYLDQALALAGKMEPYDADCARLRIAFRLAPTHPTEAVRVSEATGIGADGFMPYGRQFQASTLGWVDEAIGPNDRALGCSLIDRAFDVLMAADEEQFWSDAYGGCPTAAGFLAMQAQQIGYLDMQSVVNRALACRPSKQQSPASIESRVTVAAFLALVDPQTARGILDRIETPGEGHGHNAWLQAWLLVDAARGEALFDRALAAIESKPNTDSDFYGLVEAATVLAAPLSHKAEYIAPYMHYCRPDEQ